MGRTTVVSRRVDPMSCVIAPRRCAVVAVSLFAASVAAMAASATRAQQLDAWGSLRQNNSSAYAPEPSSQLGGGRRALDGTPRRARYPEYDHTPPPIWHGIYVGIHGGYSIAEMSSFRFNNLEISGGAFGGHLGYNWQAGNVVFGVEADGSWHDNGGSREFGGFANVRANIMQAASLRLRLGYTIENVMFYVTGGGALAGAEAALNLGPYQTRQHEMLYGYAAGAGLEVKLSHNTSGRIEAMYYGFDDKTFHFNSGWMAIDTGVTTVRAGLTYHFN